ncbi:MAG: DUF1631 domain-containing protein [Casimicrobiaceae bacterium]
MTQPTLNAISSGVSARRAIPRDSAKILNDCRDLVIHRLLTSFAEMLDRVGDLLMDRASLSDVREDQQLFLDARGALKGERPALMAEFERQLHKQIDDKIAGKDEEQEHFSTVKVDPAKLTLVENASMDEVVLTGNITRIVENLCHDELLTLNRGLGHLLGRPDLETNANPMAPAMIVDAFSLALKAINTDRRVKFQIMKELNQTSLGDIAAIYADLNAHLLQLHVIPTTRPTVFNRQGGVDRDRARATPPPRSSAEMDVMAMFKRMYGSATPMAAAPALGPNRGEAQPSGSSVNLPDEMPQSYARDAAQAPHLDVAGAAQPHRGHGLDFPAIQLPGGVVPAATGRTFAPLAQTPSGYIPGTPIISSADLHEGLTRLQAGHSGFHVGGAAVPFSGIPDGLHNVLRDLQASPLGAKANQLESMTIEMVAMLFDFIFDTKDMPDGIKALIARLQIPVLKAAMLDGAFFAKKSHPARLLVNELAQAGLGWSTVMGPEDPLYKKISVIVHKILDGFSDDLTIFEELRAELTQFLEEEEKAAEANIATTAEEINQRDRREIASVVAKAEIERRIEQHPVPNFLASFLRQQWDESLTHTYLHDGEESEAWTSTLATLDDLVWSVQPKKTAENRKHLVALLPSLLKRLAGGMHNRTWSPEAREKFMSNLVEAHAAAVKPSFATVSSPTAAVAEAAKAQAEAAKAAGDDALAAKAEALAEAMTQAVPEPLPSEREIVDDDYLEIARSLDRGTWIEFEAEDGQLAFAKLAWISPLRGTYLFTNRQGQKALSMTAEDLADRFRADRARVVEAEPLIDRAFSSMMTQMEHKLVEVAVV